MNRESLFPELTGELPLARKLRESWNTGVFPSQKIREFIDKKQISPPPPPPGAQAQPPSLDLRLGPVASRVRASFLPGKFSTVEEKIRELGMMQIALREGAVFEKRCGYIV